MGGEGGAPAPCVFQRLRLVGQELDGELAQLVPRAGLTSTQTDAVIPAGTLLPSRSRSLKAEFRRHTSLPSSPLPSHGAPPENYMIEHQWFDSLRVHRTVHLCEVILLIINDLPVERCTSTVGEERNWRRISEGEARPGVFEGAKPLHQAPSGAARSAGGERSRRSVRAEREQKKSPTVVRQSGTRRTAATYSPNWWVSTIGDGELNFSVRNGKRWILTAI